MITLEVCEKMKELAKAGKFDEMDAFVERLHLLSIVRDYGAYGWEAVSKEPNLPMHFIREFKDKLDWNEVILYTSFSSDEFIEFEKYINWYDAFMHKDLPGDVFEKHRDEIKDAVLKQIKSSYEQGIFDANIER